MSDDDLVFEGLSKTGVPVARQWWGPQSATPEAPYAVYSRREGGDVFGGNSNVFRMPWDTTTLYMDKWDDDLVELYECAVASLGTYRRNDSWEDGKFTATWDFTLVRRGERE